MNTDAHWCHHCRHHAPLADGVHCGWCLGFFNTHGRLPVPADIEPTTIQRLFKEIDSMDTPISIL